MVGPLDIAHAQNFPPQPVPAPYAAPPVYRDAGGAPIDPRYVQPGSDEDAAPGPVASQPYFAPQPLPAVDDRPPGAVSGAGVSDVTGSINSPAPSAPAALAAEPAAQSAPPPTVMASLPGQSQPDQNADAQLPSRFQRQIVNFPTPEPAGTIIVDTPNT
ncbi:MAG: L,D-transpeptidase, partial [Xanthobacteraceae bacterium]